MGLWNVSDREGRRRPWKTMPIDASRRVERIRMTKTKKRTKIWMRVRSLTPAEKSAITAWCERFINEILKPRFLPDIRPTQFNYPVDIHGKWRGSKYSFMTRYRSGFTDNAGEEFDATFTRLDHVEEHLAEIRFDVMWHRHTGQYWRLHSGVTLEEALALIESEAPLQPHI